MATPAPAPLPVTLRHLAQVLATRGEGPIRARFPGAALVVGSGGPGEMRIHTPAAGYALRTPAPDAEETCVDFAPVRSATAVAARCDGDLEVLPVVKSDRNPFAGIITVGRAGNNDLIIGSAQVSKVHAFIRQRGAGWVMSDNASRNGTVLNGERLAPKVDHPLVPGDEVQLADLRCRFVTVDTVLELCDALD